MALGPQALELSGGDRAEVGGALLTGGASRRMGFAKALIPVDGRPNAQRVAELMAQVLAGPLVEVGPGWTSLPAIEESPPGSGPLAGLVAGYLYLSEVAHWAGPVLVVACDLPLLGADALRFLAQWPGHGSLVPVWEDRPQPLCARWAHRDLELAVRLVADGKKAMKDLLAATGPEVVPGHRRSGIPAEQWADVDTPEQLGRLGLGPPAG